MASTELAHDAEALIRSLSGVVSAHVRTGPRGIEAIHVTARDDEAARFMAGHVRSALLAGLATPVTAARIHVRVDSAAAVQDTLNGSSAPGYVEPDTGTAHAQAADLHAPAGDSTPRHRIWLVEPRGPRPRLPGRFMDDAIAPEAAPVTQPPTGEQAASPSTADEVAEPGAPRLPVHRPRLVAVDVDRSGDGRVVCRVAVAYGTFVHRAEAVAVDLPGAAAQAAAQAAVRALVDAGIDGLELNGLREVEIAGRDYVLVALRRSDTSRRHRSGSAPIVGSAERSAAEATVAAANELL